MKGLVVLFAVVLLAAPASVMGWTIEEGFEGGAIPTDWTIIDGGGDGDQWFAYNNASAAHSGDWVAAVSAYSSSGAGDDWLITPQVAVSAGDSICFYAKAWYGTEDFEVRLSTTGTSMSDFTVTLGSVAGLGDAYVYYGYDLSPYAGQNCYLAIRWIYNDYTLVVDDIKVGQCQPSAAENTHWGTIKALYQ